MFSQEGWAGAGLLAYLATRPDLLQYFEQKNPLLKKHHDVGCRNSRSPSPFHEAVPGRSQADASCPGKILLAAMG